jgi:hypothetical protein
MARHVTSLCSERHYMGSSSSGRFSTDRDRRPDYEALPDYPTLMRRKQARAALRTRYLREQDVLGHTLDHYEAKRFLAWGEARATLLDSAREAAVQAGEARKAALAQAAATQLRAQLDEARDLQREASRQLRLIGVSPKAQACILNEALRRLEAAAE